MSAIAALPVHLRRRKLPIASPTGRGALFAELGLAVLVAFAVSKAMPQHVMSVSLWAQRLIIPFHLFHALPRHHSTARKVVLRHPLHAAILLMFCRNLHAICTVVNLRGPWGWNDLCRDLGTLAVAWSLMHERGLIPPRREAGECVALCAAMEWSVVVHQTIGLPPGGNGRSGVVDCRGLCVTRAGHESVPAYATQLKPHHAIWHRIRCWGVRCTLFGRCQFYVGFPGRRHQKPESLTGAASGPNGLDPVNA